jgi:hypothetical protein
MKERMEENSFLPHVYSSLGGVLPPGLVTNNGGGKVKKYEVVPKFFPKGIDKHYLF